MSINWRTPRAWAHIGLAVQFLALIRCLGEYFRLKHAEGAAFDPMAAEVFILGGLIAAVMTAASVIAYILHRPRWTAALAVLTVTALLVLKSTMM
ncbi:MAG: hypothetical protein IPL52_07835 [Flavobacteriales bacterium]|nr:hypothetical protein [Flavobacteriales bacterium]